MRKNRSQYSNAKYPNLYHLPDQKCWIYRRYSSERRKDFYCSTGLEAIDRNAPAAYKIGVERFNAWLGAFIPKEGTVYVRDLARAVLASKDDPELSERTYEIVRNEVEKHIIPACGHMKPGSVTTEWWNEYQRSERKRPRVREFRDGTQKTFGPRTKLFNTRKTLLEILRLAHGRGLIEKVPVLPLNDSEAPPPRYIPRADILNIIRFAGRINPYLHRGTMTRESRYSVVPLKLLVFIMWKQGARPGEILQYKWSMLRWNEGLYGTLEIPAEITKTRRQRSIPLNSKVSRILRFLERHKRSDWVFPSPVNPGEPIKGYRSPWLSVMKRLGLDYDVYNLRDTFITDRLGAGKSATFIGKYSDTSESMIRKRYAVSVRSMMEGVAE